MRSDLLLHQAFVFALVPCVLPAPYEAKGTTSEGQAQLQTCCIFLQIHVVRRTEKEGKSALGELGSASGRFQAVLQSSER